jgi:hypothetical protein
LALCLSGLIATAAPGGVAPTQDSSKLAERIAAIKKEHRELERKFHEDLTTFRADNKKVQDLNDEYHKASHKQAEELIRLIKAHGKEPAAFEGMLVPRSPRPWAGDRSAGGYHRHLSTPKKSPALGRGSFGWRLPSALVDPQEAPGLGPGIVGLVAFGTTTGPSNQPNNPRPEAGGFQCLRDVPVR